MNRKQQKPTEFAELSVTVKGHVYPAKTLFFRVGMAQGKDAEGRVYEVSSNINGDSILVRRQEPTSGPWLALGSEALIRAYTEQVEVTEKTEDK